MSVGVDPIAKIRIALHSSRLEPEERLKRRVINRDAPVSKESAGTQLEAIREWGLIPSSERYAMLAKIRHRTLIVHGSKDIVIMPINAFLLAQHLPDAQLVIYLPGCHGAASQHADAFLQQARQFLSA